ncbi:MAG: putative sulfate exporter family transporter [Salegentibacter sp.]
MKNPVVQKTLFLCGILLAFSGSISSPEALLLGFVLTLLAGQPFPELTQKATKSLLKISVVGLGFGMYITETLQTGKEALGLTIFTIVSTLCLGWLLAKLLKIESDIAHLIASGTSICGGSAIAAVSSVIQAKPKSISVSLGVIFFLNSMALFIFPVVGHYLHMNQHQFGLWAAVAIHDTSSVVGAAMSYGEEALKVATTVKLARSLWIIPVSLLSVFLFKKRNGKIKIPWFILLFVLAILLNSYLQLPLVLTKSITGISKRLLIVTLFLVGSSLSPEDIRKTGWKPFLLGIGLWVFISIGALLYILN